MQIFVELIPGVDHLVDSLAIELDQCNNNLRRHWACLYLKTLLIKKQFTGEKYMFPAFEGLGVPTDVAYLKDTSWWLEKGLALQELHLTSDRAHQAKLPMAFDIGTLWVITSTIDGKAAIEAAKLLNVQYDDNLGEAYVPISLTFMAESENSQGVKILTNMRTGGRGLV